MKIVQCKKVFLWLYFFTVFDLLLQIAWCHKRTPEHNGAVFEAIICEIDLYFYNESYRWQDILGCTCSVIYCFSAIIKPCKDTVCVGSICTQSPNIFYFYIAYSKLSYSQVWENEYEKKTQKMLYDILIHLFKIQELTTVIV